MSEWVSINLRAWREERNAGLQKSFQRNALLALVLALLVVLGVNYFFSMQLQKQKQRTQFLQTEIDRVQRSLLEIAELNKQRTLFQERLNVISELQVSRPITVKLFEQLVRVLPENVFYSDVRRTGNTLIINGLADNDTDVSLFMRNLAAADLFAEPRLTQITQDDIAPGKRRFNLSVSLRTPNGAEG